MQPFFEAAAVLFAPQAAQAAASGWPTSRSSWVKSGFLHLAKALPRDGVPKPEPWRSPFYGT
jgi:hypothetical protein